MSDQSKKKHVDQLIQHLQVKMAEEFQEGEINGPELWSRLRSAGSEAVEEAAEMGLLPPPGQQIECQTSEDDPNTLVVRISGLPYPPSV